MLLTIACTLALTAGHVYSGLVSEPERHQVVIVGAGVAGVTAAVTLLENNVTDVVILEASDRMGGRVHTLEYGGIIVDNGAEFVQGQVGNPVYEMVKPYDFLVSYDKTFTEGKDILYTNTAGDDFNSTFVRILLTKATQILFTEEPLSKNISVSDNYNSKYDEVLKEYKVDAKLGEATRRVGHAMFNTEYATDSMEFVGASVLEGDGYPGDPSLKWKQPRGYSIVLDMLTKKFPNPEEELPVLNKTMFNKEVTEIIYGGGKEVKIKCADGSSYLADHVIVTVSLGVLKKHADTMFQPALPERKTAAIKDFGMGNLGKMWILFPKRWWPENTHALVPLFSDEELLDYKKTSVHGNWTTENTGFLPVLGNDRMFECWYSGEACRIMESLTDDQAIEGVMELLNRTMGHKFADIPRPESVLRSSWSRNPYTLGSYSYRSVIGDKNNRTHSDLAAPMLDNNKPVVMFAGEATNTPHYGLVPGALETGQREAQNLINYLKNNKR